LGCADGTDPAPAASPPDPRLQLAAALDRRLYHQSALVVLLGNLATRMFWSTDHVLDRQGKQMDRMTDIALGTLTWPERIENYPRHAQVRCSTSTISCAPTHPTALAMPSAVARSW
jgi:hypothetical protein